MSMADLTVMQTIQLFVIYLGMMLLLPAFAFGTKLKTFSYPLRMMAYYAIGNFFLINLVLYLQLMHLSYRPTLIIGTVLFYGYFALRFRGIRPARVFFSFLDLMNRRYTRSMGWKSFWRTLKENSKPLRKNLWQWCKRYVLCRLPEWIAAIGLLAFLWYLFGNSYLVNLGYGASDIPVHNNWINELSKENLFCDGIYPFGMHAQVYYIHQVFGMDTYVILRLWGILNTYTVTFGLVGFLAWACESRTFLALLGGFCYVAPAVIQQDLWYRFFSALPQEFGMSFILPAIAFLLEFFRRRKEEPVVVVSPEAEEYCACGRKDNLGKQPWRIERVNQKCKAWSSELRQAPASTACLFFFALLLACSISIHFYPAIITLILCLGVGIGFVGVIFRKPYFASILRSGILAFVLATAPMFLAFLGGTPFQGSMNWAVSVMTQGGSGEDTEFKAQDFTVEGSSEGGEVYFYDSKGNLVAVGEPGTTIDDLSGDEIARLTGVDNRSFFEKVTERAKHFREHAYEIPEAIKANTDLFLLRNENRNAPEGYAFLWLCPIALLLGILCLLLRRRFYGSVLCSFALGYGMLLLVMATDRLHLPVIMDINRGRLFMYYLVPLMCILIINTLFVFVEPWYKNTWISGVIAMVASVMFVAWAVDNRQVQTPMYVESMEYPGAITCLTNIVSTDEPFHYTVLSANDELHMVEESGYHYEVISLLKHLALYEGGVYDGTEISDLTDVDEGHLYLPTEDIYVFIETVPQDYFLPYMNSGQRISEAGAKRALPDMEGLGIYQGENRWICMSKLYYWVKAFEKLHPDAVSVYYQDDVFVCYRIHQNVYSLYDLCIDYGYNHCGEKEITVHD
ncbi:MAG: hypothetical protein K6G04_01190 [Lachnospiraceae bacterium]|nr:hypothetical protein [Lachnospiraceae bacterium]